MCGIFKRGPTIKSDKIEMHVDYSMSSKSGDNRGGGCGSDNIQIDWRLFEDLIEREIRRSGYHSGDDIYIKSVKLTSDFEIERLKGDIEELKEALCNQS